MLRKSSAITGAVALLITGVAQANQVLNVYRQGNIVVDGNLSEWSPGVYRVTPYISGNRGGNPPVQASHATATPDQFGDNALTDNPNYASMTGSHAGNVVDHTSYVGARFTETHLYFGAYIYDSDDWAVDPNAPHVEQTGAGIEANDSIAFYIDPMMGASTEPLSNSTSAFRLVVDAKGEHYVFDTTDAYRAQLMAGITSAAVYYPNHAGGYGSYMLEVSIELAAMNPDMSAPTVARRRFGLDLVFQDTDSTPGLSGTLSWSNRHSPHSKIPDHWGDGLMAPCNDPFADADNDHDVDQGDFAVFQSCIADYQQLWNRPAYCMCFDQFGDGPDGDVDTFDYNMFELCATGPGVVSDPGCDDIIYPPIITQVPPDPDQIVESTQYIRQLALSQGTLPVTWSLLNFPTGAVIDPNTGKISGWIPGSGDVGASFTFEVAVSNSAGTDTASWHVLVRRLNNGFDPNQVFAIRNYPHPENPAWPPMGKIMVYDEGTGAFVRDYTSVEGWTSLTFSGVGTNDAWCYTLRSWNTGEVWHHPPSDGLNIRKFTSDGNVDTQVLVQDLSGWLPGTDVQEGSIRYSSFHNSLFIGVDRNQGATDQAIVYQLNLGLTAILNTYTGPNTNTGGQVNLDINRRDGTLYMVNQRLGDDNGSGGPLGDLVAFDTSTGSTSIYTTLVNGQTFAADGQPDHDKWALPNSAIYRAGATSSDDTILVFVDQSPYNIMEFWLDTTAHPKDGNGNLQLKGLLPAVSRGWNGQQDTVNGNIHYGAMADGWGTLRADNSQFEPFNDAPDWLDADSAPYVSPGP